MEWQTLSPLDGTLSLSLSRLLFCTLCFSRSLALSRFLLLAHKHILTPTHPHNPPHTHTHSHSHALTYSNTVRRMEWQVLSPLDGTLVVLESDSANLWEISEVLPVDPKP